VSGGETSGAQRAALFLLSLDKEAAATVIKHLDEGVIVEVVEAMAQLDPNRTDLDAVKRLDKELVKALHRPRAARLKSAAELQNMLEQTLGRSQASALFDKINQRLLHERPFIGIEKYAAAHVAKALGEESEAVAALALAHLDPALTAEVLASFEPARSLAVVKRMAALVPPGFETLVAVAGEIERRLEALASEPAPPDPTLRLRSIAEVLNFSQPEVEKSLLEGLGAANAELAQEIREFMFTWEDLAKVDKRAMQKILASVDTKTLAIALKACSEAVQANIMSNLSSRVREMVADERELAGPMPMAEVRLARDEIMKAVRALMESGDFRPTRAGEELVT
jgi:flagellar motor switch protein FliG